MVKKKKEETNISYAIGKWNGMGSNRNIYNDVCNAAMVLDGKPKTLSVSPRNYYNLLSIDYVTRLPVILLLATIFGYNPFTTDYNYIIIDNNIADNIAVLSAEDGQSVAIRTD
jgi:hypothetical protein